MLVALLQDVNHLVVGVLLFVTVPECEDGFEPKLCLIVWCDNVGRRGARELDLEI
jgi:hypothetical protein